MLNGIVHCCLSKQCSANCIRTVALHSALCGSMLPVIALVFCNTHHVRICAMLLTISNVVLNINLSVALHSEQRQYAYACNYYYIIV